MGKLYHHPTTWKGTDLSLLYEGHPGISKMKELAHGYVWWSNIDADLEAHVKKCN